MNNPNQKIQGAFGDVFTPNTSYTDRLSQQLYAEQRQREAKAEQMNAALDDQFSRNLLNIRDVDSNDISNAYTEFKIANINAMKQKGGIPIEQQKDLLRKKANMYNAIKASQDRRKYEAETLKDMRDKGGKGISYYEPDAQQRLMQHMNTPIGKLKETGEDMYDYRYKGQNYKDAADDMFKAAGTGKSIVEGSPVKSATDNLTMETPQYEIPKNTPEDVKNFYLSKMLSRPDAKQHYEWLLGNLPKDALTEMDKAYNAITPEEWKLRGGKPSIQHKNIDNAADTFSTYMAQKYAVENAPRFVKNVPHVNKQLLTQQTNKEWDRRKRQSHNDAMEVVRENKANGRPPDEGLENPLDRIILRASEIATVDGKRVPVVRESNISDHEMGIINPMDKAKGKYGSAPVKATMSDGKVANVYLIEGENLRGDKPILREDAGEVKAGMIGTKQKVINTQNINRHTQGSAPSLPKGNTLKTLKPVSK
jgi:hypothetical protein